MDNRAKSSDWKTKPLPAATAVLPFEKTISKADFAQISMGLIPFEMEDKWFMYVEGDQLNIHRSWTGHHIYQVTIQALDADTYYVTRAVVNSDSQQYTASDLVYNARLLHFLIDCLLLGKNVTFPSPDDVTDNDGIFRHAMVGYATPTSAKAPVPMEDRLTASIALGAIGDAIGSYYEGKPSVQNVSFDLLQGVTDDTQLTLATCEAIIQTGRVTPESIAKRMLWWYNQGKLVGLGSSTLKALRDLQMGAHWGLSGRGGEYAAGNGAAMRIAPLAFFIDPEQTREVIRDVCNITHKNDEAYVGCLAVIYAIHFIIHEKWDDDKTLIELIVPHLPDTGVRDNLIKLLTEKPRHIVAAAKMLGTSGHVIESVPFAIFAAQQVKHLSVSDILTHIIQSGGDTDTNASIAGQIMGAFLGSYDASLFSRVRENELIIQTATSLSRLLKPPGASPSSPAPVA